MLRKSLVTSFLALGLSFTPAIAAAGEGAECTQGPLTLQTLVDKHLKARGGKERLKAAEAFWNESDSAEQQIEAMVLLAQKLKARPKFVASLSVERKAKHLAHFPGMPDVLAARLLVSYHLGHQRPLMAAFLDGEY